MFRKKCKQNGYSTKQEAWEKAAIEKTPGALMEVFNCFECGQWHIREEARKEAV